MLRVNQFIYNHKIKDSDKKTIFNICIAVVSHKWIVGYTMSPPSPWWGQDMTPVSHKGRKVILSSLQLFLHSKLCSAVCAVQ